MTQEALRLALEALDDLAAWNDGEVGGHMDEPYSAEVARRTITAIKEALREHAMREVQRIGQEIEQEPVAWLEPEWGERICPEVGFEATITSDHPRDLCWIPLYPHPPQRTWVGLTDEDVKNLCLSVGTEPIEVRLIEAKLKEKNT